MQRAIRPRWLLRLADELCYREGGAGQPRNTNLRHSVSAAYYAVFHELTLAAARHLYPHGDTNEVNGIRRSLDHGAIFQVCGWIKGNTPKEHSGVLVERARESMDVIDIADWFLQLLDERHKADYDHMADFSKAATQSLVDLAYDAVEKIEKLSTAASRELAAFMALIALQSSIR